MFGSTRRVRSGFQSGPAWLATAISFTPGFSRVKEDQADRRNRFNVFRSRVETVKTVLIIEPTITTGLKPGVNKMTCLIPG